LKEGLVAGVVAIFLGMLAIFIGWTIIGGLGLGIPALLLAMRSYRKGHRLLGVFGIIFSCVGIIEGLAIAGIVGLLSILTMPTRIEVTTTPTVKVETVTKTLTVTVKEIITRTPEKIAPTIETTEPIKTGHQIFKWRLLWEKRLNDTAYQIKVSPNGKFVSVIAGRQLLVFSRDGNIPYSVGDLREVGFRYGSKLLSISDEGESWILEVSGLLYEEVHKLAIVKDGKAVWVVDLPKILRDDDISSIAISQDGNYVALSGDWIHFSRRENNSLVVLWKFKPIEKSPKIAISGDNRYICFIGLRWAGLLDNQGKLIWEKDLAAQYGLGWSPPYFITNSNLIGISSSGGRLVLIFDLEGQLIRKIRREDIAAAIVVNYSSE
jgi:hypothetical protein